MPHSLLNTDAEDTAVNKSKSLSSHGASVLAGEVKGADSKEILTHTFTVLWKNAKQIYFK